MELLITIVLSASLLLISYQDFKDRAVWWWLFPLVMIMGVGKGWSPDDYFISIGFNLGFLLIQWLGLSLYFSVKHREWTNIIDRQLGLGDVLLLLGLATVFSPINFLLFYIVSIVFSLIIAIAFGWHKQGKTIPLAGLQAICWIIVLGIEWAFNISFLSTDLVTLI